MPDIDLTKLRADVDYLFQLPERVQTLEEDVGEIKRALDSLATRTEIADVARIGKSTRAWSIFSAVSTSAVIVLLMSLLVLHG